MRIPILFILLLVFIGCQADTASAPEETKGYVPDPSTAVEEFYGFPEGETPLAGVPGIYTEDEFNSPEAERARAALPAVSLELANLVVNAESWDAADEQVRAFLEHPSSEAYHLPRYLLEQAAAQNMVQYSDLLTTTADSPRRREVVAYYLDLLIKNRFPDPKPIAEMLWIVGKDWEPAQLARAAVLAKTAHALYLERREKMYERCPACRQLDEETPFKMKQEMAWDDALAELSALAQR